MDPAPTANDIAERVYEVMPDVDPTYLNNVIEGLLKVADPYTVCMCVCECMYV